MRHSRLSLGFALGLALFLLAPHYGAVGQYPGGDTWVFTDGSEVGTRIYTEPGSRTVKPEFNPDTQASGTIATGVAEVCNSDHFHGTLRGNSDPASSGCGWGRVRKETPTTTSSPAPTPTATPQQTATPTPEGIPGLEFRKAVTESVFFPAPNRVGREGFFVVVLKNTGSEPLTLAVKDVVPDRFQVLGVSPANDCPLDIAAQIDGQTVTVRNIPVPPGKNCALLIKVKPVLPGEIENTAETTDLVHTARASVRVTVEFPPECLEFSVPCSRFDVLKGTMPQFCPPGGACIGDSGPNTVTAQGDNLIITGGAQDSLKVMSVEASRRPPADVVCAKNGKRDVIVISGAKKTQLVQSDRKLDVIVGGRAGRAKRRHCGNGPAAR